MSATCRTRAARLYLTDVHSRDAHGPFPGAGCQPARAPTYHPNVWAEPRDSAGSLEGRVVVRRTSGTGEREDLRLPARSAGFAALHEGAVSKSRLRTTSDGCPGCRFRASRLRNCPAPGCPALRLACWPDPTQSIGRFGPDPWSLDGRPSSLPVTVPSPPARRRPCQVSAGGHSANCHAPARRRSPYLVATKSEPWNAPEIDEVP